MTTDEDSHDDETDLGELDLFLSLKKSLIIVWLGWADRNLVNGPGRKTLRQLLRLKYGRQGGSW